MERKPRNYTVYVGEKWVKLETKPEKAAHVEDNFFPFFPDSETLDQMVRKSGKPTGRLADFARHYREMIQAFRKVFLFQFAAGGLVWNGKNEILFIYRKNHWDLPKGGIEPGETKRQAAIRETQEETGVDGLSILRKLSPSYHTFWRNGFFVLKKTSWFEMICEGNQIPRPQAEEGITEARWVPIADIPSIFPDAYPAIRNLVLEVLELPGHPQGKPAGPVEIDEFHPGETQNQPEVTSD